MAVLINHQNSTAKLPIPPTQGLCLVGCSVLLDNRILPSHLLGLGPNRQNVHTTQPQIASGEPMVSMSNTRGQILGALVCFFSIWIAAHGLAQERSSAQLRDRNVSSIYTVSKYDPDHKAAQDLSATIKRAKAGNKRIILEIGGDW